MRRAIVGLGAVFSLVLGALGVVVLEAPLSASSPASGAAPSWTIDHVSRFSAALPFAITCLTAETCIALGDDTINETTDGGDHWTEQKSGIDVFGAVSCPSASECVAVGGDYATNREEVTSDGGASWRPVTVPAGIEPLVAVTCPSVVDCYAVASSITAAKTEILRSTDGGHSWKVTPIDLGLRDLTTIGCVAVGTCFAAGLASDGTGGVITTHNAGKSWSSVAVPAGATYFASMSCFSTTRCTIAGGTSDPGGSGLALTTTTAGSTWTLETLPPPFTGVSDLSCDDASVCVALGSASSGERIGYSIDGGTNWSDSGTSLTATSQTVAVACAAESCLTAGPGPVGPTFEASTDGGITWSAGMVLGPPTVNSLSCSSVNDCATVMDGNTGVTTSGETGWVVADAPEGMGQNATPLSCPTPTECVGVSFAQIDQSSDGGASWSVAPFPGDSLAAVSCPGATTCTAVGVAIDGGQDDPMAWTTSDGGGTWTGQSLPVAGPQSPVRSLPSGVSCSTIGRCVVVFGNGEIARTANGGTTWKVSVTPPNVSALSAVDCPTSGTCYAVGKAQESTIVSLIMASSNGGKTWVVDWTTGGTDYLDGVSCTTGTTCVAVGNGQIPILTTTNGSTWTEPAIPSGKIGPSFGLFAVSCVTNTHHCLLGGADRQGGVALDLDRS